MRQRDTSTRVPEPRGAMDIGKPPWTASGPSGAARSACGPCSQGAAGTVACPRRPRGCARGSASVRPTLAGRGRRGISSTLQGPSHAVAAPTRLALAKRMALRFPIRLDSPRTVPAQSPHSPRTVPDGNLHSPRSLLIFKGNRDTSSSPKRSIKTYLFLPY